MPRRSLLFLSMLILLRNMGKLKQRGSAWSWMGSRITWSHILMKRTQQGRCGRPWPLCMRELRFNGRCCLRTSREYQMQKGEEIDPFLLRLQGIQDQLTSVGSTLDPEFMIRTALNAVTEDWETFVQSILGRASLPSWEKMWAALR